ncbi:hypothetical protein C8J57DRAFT_1468535 [Mycena rebaudengoi]|nr:hypothetical protein C8J57DRAFT_1468535 [Mycena rebaudengoi]
MKFSVLTVLLAGLVVAFATSLESNILPSRGPNHDIFRRQNTSNPVPTNLTNAQLEIAYEATCGAINSSVGESAIRADIANATNNSIAIDQTFSQIYAQLLVIDSENLNNGSLFGPTWKEIQQNWTNILFASRTTASNTAAYCTEFTTVIMPFVSNMTGPVPIEISVDVLQKYSNMADDLASEADATAQTFAEIMDSMNNFTAMFSAFAAAEGSADQQMIDQLNKDIAGLNHDIKIYHILIALDAVAMGLTVLSVPAILYVMPESGALMLHVAGVLFTAEIIGLAVLQTLVEQARADIKTKQDNITSLTVELDQISQDKYTLSEIQNSTQTMNLQLQAFAGIWGAVKSDCAAVSDYITSVPGARLPQALWAAQNQVQCVYEGVATGLTDYAIGISDSGIPPPTVDLTRELASEDFPTKLQADTQALVAAAWAKADSEL